MGCFSSFGLDVNNIQPQGSPDSLWPSHSMLRPKKEGGKRERHLLHSKNILCPLTENRVKDESLKCFPEGMHTSWSQQISKITSERRQSKKSTAWIIPLYKILRNANWSTVTEGRSEGWGGPGERGFQGREEILRGDNVSTILTVVVCSWVLSRVETVRLHTLRAVYCMIVILHKTAF